MQKQQYPEPKQQKLEIKKKQIDIISGVFPSFLYFPFKCTLFDEVYVKQIQQLLLTHNFQFEKLDNLHLSISKTFKLYQKQASGFVDEIKSFFKYGFQLPIVLIFDSVDILQNFIILKCSPISHKKISEYTQRLNDFLKKHSYEPYFQNPIFHISLYKINIQDSQKIKQEGINKIKVSKKGYSLQKLVLRVGNKFHTIKQKPK